jgi:hypothetical protein
MHAGKWAVVLTTGLLGWALSTAVLRIASSAMPLAEALVIHAVLAPIIFIFVSRFYFQKFAYTTPLRTAGIFACVVILMDFFVTGLYLRHRLDLFVNLLATWIPLLLIFSATHITGLLVASASRYKVPAR